MSRYILQQLKRVLCCVLVFMIATSVLCLALAMSVDVKANTSTKLYKSASTSSASVSIKKGTRMTLKSIDGNWAKVKYNGKTAYIALKNLNTVNRITAYTNRNTHIYKTASSGSSSKSVSKNTKVYIVGKSGNYYRVQNASGSVTGYIRDSHLSKKKSSSTSSGSGSATTVSNGLSWKSKVTKMAWGDGGSTLVAKGSYAYIYDIDTGIKMRIKRMGGTRHMDVEPATSADTAKLKRIAGGKFSWKSHAVILIAHGKYVAAAINTMPHGDQTLHNNDYDGQFCLHLSGSKTHGTNKTNSSHRSSINRAYNWAH